MGYAPLNKDWFKRRVGRSLFVRRSLKDRWKAALCDPAWLALAIALAVAIWLWIELK